MLGSMVMEKRGCGSFDPSEMLSRSEGRMRIEEYAKLLASEDAEVMRRLRHRDGDGQPVLAGAAGKAGERKALCYYPPSHSPPVLAAETLRTLQAPTGGSGAGEVPKKRLVIKMSGLPPKEPQLQGEAGPKPFTFEPKGMTARELRRHIERKLRGTEISLVCQKQLTASDVSAGHKRLTLPKSRMSSLAFLRADERARLEVSPYEKGDRKSGIPVMLIDPFGRLRMPTFRKWDSGKAIYVLTTAVWTDIVKANWLKERDEIQIWSFRVLDLLSMALVIVKRAPRPVYGAVDTV